MGRIPSGAKIWMLCLLSCELAVKTSQHIETGDLTHDDSNAYENLLGRVRLRPRMGLKHQPMMHNERVPNCKRFFES